jgi:hypothetical protein
MIAAIPQSEEWASGFIGHALDFTANRRGC